MLTLFCLTLVASAVGVPAHANLDHDSYESANYESASFSQSQSASTDCRLVADHHCCQQEQVLFFEEWTSSTGIVFFTTVAYLALTSSISAYKFWYAWNLIYALRRQSESTFKTRRPHPQEVLTVSRHHGADACTSCPVCLETIGQREFVTECGGCKKTFHKDCLFNWLTFRDGNQPFAHNSSCPCCRKDLLQISCPATARRDDWVSEILYFMGYHSS